MKYSAEEIIERFRKKYAGELEVQACQRRRKFSLELKQNLLSEAKANRISEKILATGLGISHSTVCNWKHQVKLRDSERELIKGTLFQKVKVEADPPVIRSQAPYIEGKSGIRVVGLSLNQMAELLRCL